LDRLSSILTGITIGITEVALNKARDFLHYDSFEKIGALFQKINSCSQETSLSDECIKDITKDMVVVAFTVVAVSTAYKIIRPFASKQNGKKSCESPRMELAQARKNPRLFIPKPPENFKNKGTRPNSPDSVMSIDTRECEQSISAKRNRKRKRTPPNDQSQIRKNLEERIEELLKNKIMRKITIAQNE